MQLLERCAPLRIVASIKIVVAAAALEAVVATDAEEIVSSVEVLEDVVAIAVPARCSGSRRP